MIIEAYKLVSSIFPFIKEAFLWPDGAEVGKPITQENLTRRKIAVFVLVGSLLVNYLAITELLKYYQEHEVIEKNITQLTEQLGAIQAKNEDLNAQITHMVPNNEVSEIAKQQIEDEIAAGILQRVKPSAQTKDKKDKKL